MDCPFCKQLLPENHGGGVCPHCGRDLTTATASQPNPPPPFKLKWRWFWLGLFAPPLLTMLTAYTASHATSGGSNESFSPAIALIGSGIGGIICGIVLGTRLGKEAATRTGLSFLFSAGMVVVCFILSFCGCNLGGYHFDMK